MTADTTRQAPNEDERFAFGRNWESFSEQLDQKRIAGARAGVERLLQTSDLRGRTLLDIGCGSGLMALAAHEMGARVLAFDYDSDSVRTAQAVRDRFAGPGAYEVLQGSALDRDFILSLGTFDVVYSWGVLHHTGDLWTACDLATRAVAPEGMLAIAIYNDQGLASRMWTRTKKRYVESGPTVQKALVAGVGAYFAGRRGLAHSFSAASALARRDMSRMMPPREARARGMDRKHDLVDWVGGYPFEVAKPEEIFNFYRQRGFLLEGLTTCAGGLGCNEFLFTNSSIA
jgi:2-polyprenyl-3-methyl-5-hydroxy-6-metoxy-1,4-benzoquinol methylase